jgi:nitrogen regulatory protein PII
MKAGAAGGTIIFGRGMGIHEKKKIMGVSLEPEKEIVLSVVCANKADAILKEIVCATDLEKPGTGIAFMLPIDKVLGIHIILLQIFHRSMPPAQNLRHRPE